MLITNISARILAFVLTNEDTRIYILLRATLIIIIMNACVKSREGKAYRDKVMIFIKAFTP